MKSTSASTPILTMTQPFGVVPPAWIRERGEVLPTIRQRSKYTDRKTIGKRPPGIHSESLAAGRVVPLAAVPRVLHAVRTTSQVRGCANPRSDRGLKVDAPHPQARIVRKTRGLACSDRNGWTRRTDATSHNPDTRRNASCVVYRTLVSIAR